MFKNRKPLFTIVAMAAVVTLAQGASAEVGKKMAVTRSGGSGTIAQTPAVTSYLSVAVPTSYKSKTNFLKVTTTYRAYCDGADVMSSQVDAGGVIMIEDSFPNETFTEDADSQFVSRTFYLAPESVGGPAVPAGSTVSVKLTSTSGIGCFVDSGTMIVESLKKISATRNSSGGLAPQFPAMTTFLSTAVPSSYKSKTNFLMATVSYRASCSGGDYLGEQVDVGGVLMIDNDLPVVTWDEDADSQFVSRTYYLVPESLGGPAVPAASTVTAHVTSIAGTGCTVDSGTMTVESLK